MKIFSYMPEAPFGVQRNGWVVSIFFFSLFRFVCKLIDYIAYRLSSMFNSAPMKDRKL